MNKWTIKHGYYSLIILTLTISSCKKEKSCEGCIARNQPPIAIAGPDQTISLPLDSVLLDGSASNDPDGKIISWTWIKISGPSSSNFSDATGIYTQVNDLVAGDYEFVLKVTDAGGMMDTDTIYVKVNEAPDTSPVDIYIAGQLNGLPVYWKNGDAIYFDRSSAGFMATDIAVSENKIYVSQSLIGLPYQQWRAKYWDNGVMVPLGKAASTKSIAVSGTDVYVAGFEWEAGKPETVAKYWKNGQPKALTDGTRPAYAKAIAISGNDVYVVGNVDKHWVLWKNDLSVFLTNDSIYAGANDICIVGNDVYVAGEIFNPEGWDATLAAYWKNGELVKLDSGINKNSYASSLTIVNGDVYVGGVEHDGSYYKAKYWKNGQEVWLKSDTHAYANSIAVYESDVYVAGGKNGYQPVYWKNGKEILLGSDGIALSIVVIQH